MSLIEDIQAASISETSDVSAFLRKCKLLAARLDAKQLAEWVDHELSGYPEDAILPSYRIVKAKSYGNFVGPFGMRGNGLQIPLWVLPSEVARKNYGVVRMGDAISSYQSLLIGDGSGSARIPWPVELAVTYASKSTPDMQCVEAWIDIPIPAIHRLIDSVKTAVLGFAIDIQREAPDAGESPVGAPRPIPEERVTQIFNTNVAGSVGNIANGGSDFQQTATVNAQAGDWEMLAELFRSLGIADEASPALRTELDTIRDEAPETRNAKGRHLIARLISKAAASGAGVAVDVAATGISKAIAGYLWFSIS